jgi:phenylacetate-CoA ligase
VSGHACDSRAAVEASQLEQLRSLVAELFPGNAFYSKKLNDRGITFDIASLADFAARFPFTTKRELVDDQRAHPPFGSNLTYPLSRYTRFHQTSGTSAAPLRWLDTPESWDWMLENWAEVFRSAGVGPGDRIFFAFSFGPFIGFWLAFECAGRLGCLCVPGGGLGSVGRMQAILDNGITVLCATPTYAMRLAETAAENNLKIENGKVRRLIVAGEPGGSVAGTRSRLEQLWPGARIFDHHGMTEVGPASHQCPAQPGRLHILEPAYLPEVIEPNTGRTLGAGETGELVLTTLGRAGSPVLRYRTGDIVRRGEIGQCACGSFGMALEGGILGRTDDMVVVRGVNIFPSTVEDVLRRNGLVAEYNVELAHDRGMQELRVSVEPGPACEDPNALAGALEEAFRKALSLRVEIRIVPAGSLPRFEMKARRWVKS